MNERRNYIAIFFVGGVSFFSCLYVLYQIFSVPNNFPVNKTFTVNESESLKSISERLRGEGYITSPILFRAGISFFGKDRALQVGGYVFEKPLALSSLISLFVQGKPSSPLLAVTIPEGSTSFEIAAILAKAIPGISVDVFNTYIKAQSLEGRLFPSTYFLLPSYKEEDIIKLMLNTFTKKVSPQIPPESIHLPLRNQNEVLVLASILEGEAKKEEDMKIVSGILLARLQKGMLLQVDVAQETYKEKGLPSTPINNPGITAIEAALHPTPSEYFYYITGKDGNMHYAKTFEEHKKNIAMYLR